MNGRIAVGWPAVEDLACVLVLALMPLLAGSPGGRCCACRRGTARGRLWARPAGSWRHSSPDAAGRPPRAARLLWQVVKTGSRELFTLSVIAAAIGIAHGLRRCSAFRSASGSLLCWHGDATGPQFTALQESPPLRDAFSAPFFVSVGMLFEPRVLVAAAARAGRGGHHHGGQIAGGIGAALSFRYPLKISLSLTVAASLAQIGEFCLHPGWPGVARAAACRGMSLVLAGALISIALNPL